MNPPHAEQSRGARPSFHPGRLGVASARFLVLMGLLGLASWGSHPVVEAAHCAKHYVAGGDHIPAGHEVNESERYPSHLLEGHLLERGPWCVYNTAENEATSSSYISGGQLATTWNRQPDLITLTVGGENSTIVKLITTCFDKVKDHDFSGANVCAAEILANATVWTNLENNLITIFQQYRMIMAGRPQLVVAVTTYPNPYPSAASATLNIALLCLPLIDTIPTCTIRWAQLPPALLTIDAVIQKLNTTIAEAVEPFTMGSQGRFVLVDVYPKFQSHCMKMDVRIETTVEHPEQKGAVHQPYIPHIPAAFQRNSREHHDRAV